MSGICQERQGSFRIRQERTRFSLVTRGKLFQPGWAVMIHPQSSPELAPLYDPLVWSLWISLIGVEFSFPGRVLWSEREQCCGMMEQWNCMKGGRGQWNKTVTTLSSSCSVPLFWGKWKLSVSWHLMLRSEQNFWWSQYSMICVPNVGLCCHLVATFRNDSSVRVSRKSGWLRGRSMSFDGSGI